MRDIRTDLVPWLRSAADHSYLNAIIGSTPAARRAGTHAAPRAIPVSANASTEYVQGSVALSPYKKDPTARDAHNAPGTPIDIPLTISTALSPITCLSTRA